MTTAAETNTMRLHKDDTMLVPDDFAYAIADSTRLRVLVLLIQKEELCVCQLTDAIDIQQPKMSRHLSILRKKNILLHRRNGLWIFYRLHPELPVWAYQTLQKLSLGCLNLQPYQDDLVRVKNTDACLPDGHRIKQIV